MRLQLIHVLPLFILACTPAFVNLDVEEEILTNSDESNDDEDDIEDVNNQEERCCYTIEMFDSNDDGWDRGFIQVLVDDENYTKAWLPTGYGFQEVCPERGSTLSMDWYPPAHSQGIGFTVYSPEGDILIEERRPEEGQFLSVDVECTDEFSVSPEYQEESSSDEINPDDPNDPHDRPSFEGEYSGYFRLTNAQTGYQLCESEMPIEISGNMELLSSGSCYTQNGHELNFYHNGQLAVQDVGWETGVPNDGDLPPDFAAAYLYGNVEMVVPSGDAFSSEFYGECYQEGDYIGVYLWWEMTVQAPNETRYYYGELSAY